MQNPYLYQYNLGIIIEHVLQGRLMTHLRQWSSQLLTLRILLTLMDWIYSGACHTFMVETRERKKRLKLRFVPKQLQRGTARLSGFNLAYVKRFFLYILYLNTENMIKHSFNAQNMIILFYLGKYEQATLPNLRSFLIIWTKIIKFKII